MSRLEYAAQRVALRFLAIGVLLGGFGLFVAGFVFYLFLFDAERFREIVHDPSTGDPVQDLNSPNDGRRLAALKQLAEGPVDKSNREVVERIKDQLNDTDWDNRHAAIAAWAVWGNQDDDVPAIIAILEAGERMDKEHYYMALANLGGTQASDFLAVQLADFWNRRPANEALLQMGDAAESSVAGLLSHEDPEARVAACKVLEQIGTAASLEVLDQAATDPEPSVAGAAERAREAIQTREDASSDTGAPVGST